MLNNKRQVRPEGRKKRPKLKPVKRCPHQVLLRQAWEQLEE